MLIWMPFACIIIFLGILTWIRLTTVPECEIAHAHQYLRRVDMSLINDLFDPATETALRLSLSASGFRKVQRKRMILAFEQIRRMAHNSAVLAMCVRSQYRQIEKKQRFLFTDEDRLILSAVQSSSRARRSARFGLFKLILWNLIHLEYWFFFPSPNLFDIRQTFNLDLLASYDELVERFAEVALRVDVAAHEKLIAAL